MWGRIADVVDGPKLDSLTTEVALGDVAPLAPEILAGKVKGRVVVNCA